MKNYMSLKNCLFDTFANPRLMRECTTIWAIQEGINRQLSNWRIVRARKDHECIKGCFIEYGTFYVKDVDTWDYTDHKFCLSCAAMILYYQGVYKLPAVNYTHYSKEDDCPIFSAEFASGER